MDEQGPGIGVPVSWVGIEDMSIFFANQFICQFEQNEFVLTFGQMSPPLLLGTQEERIEQAEQIAYVPIKPLARLGFSEMRLRELIAVLEANLRQYEEHQRQIRGGEQGWPS